MRKKTRLDEKAIETSLELGVLEKKLESLSEKMTGDKDLDFLLKGRLDRPILESLKERDLKRPKSKMPTRAALDELQKKIQKILEAPGATLSPSAVKRTVEEAIKKHSPVGEVMDVRVIGSTVHIDARVPFEDVSIKFEVDEKWDSIVEELKKL